MCSSASLGALRSHHHCHQNGGSQGEIPQDQQHQRHQCLHPESQRVHPARANSGAARVATDGGLHQWLGGRVRTGALPWSDGWKEPLYRPQRPLWFACSSMRLNTFLEVKLIPPFQPELVSQVGILGPELEGLGILGALEVLGSEALENLEWKRMPQVHWDLAKSKCTGPHCAKAPLVSQVAILEAALSDLAAHQPAGPAYGANACKCMHAHSVRSVVMERASKHVWSKRAEHIPLASTCKYLPGAANAQGWPKGAPQSTHYTLSCALYLTSNLHHETGCSVEPPTLIPVSELKWCAASELYTVNICKWSQMPETSTYIR